MLVPSYSQLSLNKSKVGCTQLFKVQNMKKKYSATSGLLIGGAALFTLGLLIILRLNPVYRLFQVIQDFQVIEAIGVTVLFAGQAVVVFGVMRSTSSNLISSMRADRQITYDAFNQNIQQLQIGYTQTIAKLDAVIANQQAAVIQPPSPVVMPSDCKFCGSQIEQGHFCPQCGKAN